MTEKRFTLDSEENGLCKCILMNGEEIPTCEVVELLNELAEKNQQLKQEIKGFESCSHNWGILYDEAKNKVEELSKENQELKQFKQQVFDLIDENIKHYRKYSTLTVKMPMDCKYRKTCLDNHSINVENKAKENAYQKLKKELKE